jgi:pilus assembly protein Flp/PilA
MYYRPDCPNALARRKSIHLTQLIAVRKFGSKGMTMINTRALLFLMQAWRDRRGQDLIEYALMAGFVAVAAGAIMPGISSSVSTIFSQVASVMTAAAS